MSSETRTPIHREAFISPSHAQIALRGANYPHQPAMMTIITDDGDLQEIPVPAEYVQRGVLPPGYAVDFLFDPEELVAKLRNAGGTYMEELPEATFQKMSGMINTPDNMKIIPQWMYDRKRGITRQAVSENTTPEAVMDQMMGRSEPSGPYEAQGEGSERKKEKKKGFLKSLFGKK